MVRTDISGSSTSRGSRSWTIFGSVHPLDAKTTLSSRLRLVLLRSGAVVVGFLQALLPPCWWLTETIEGGGMACAEKWRMSASWLLGIQNRDDGCQSSVRIYPHSGGGTRAVGRSARRKKGERDGARKSLIGGHQVWRCTVAEWAKQACAFLHGEISQNPILIVILTPPDLDDNGLQGTEYYCSRTCGDTTTRSTVT